MTCQMIAAVGDAPNRGMSLLEDTALYSEPSNTRTTPVSIASGSPARNISSATPGISITSGPRASASSHPISAVSSSSVSVSMYARTSSALRWGSAASDRNGHSSRDVASSSGMRHFTDLYPIRTIACTCSCTTGTPPFSRMW